MHIHTYIYIYIISECVCVEERYKINHFLAVKWMQELLIFRVQKNL